jgi:hypothetical protein
MAAGDQAADDPDSLRLLQLGYKQELKRGLSYRRICLLVFNLFRLVLD